MGNRNVKKDHHEKFSTCIVPELVVADSERSLRRHRLRIEASDSSGREAM